MTADELEYLAAYAPSYAFRLVLLAGTTGNRINELFTLTDDRVDLRFHNVGWVTATDFIRREIAVDESERRSRWYELNKRRTVSFIGSRPPRMGDGTAWRARVDHVIEDPTVDLGELLHRNGIDTP